MSLGKIKSAAVIGAMQLEIGWDDGRVGRVDLADLIGSRPALAPLKSEAEFVRVRISDDGWSLEWPIGIDFGAAQLRRWADEQAGETMPAAAFRKWMETHNLTQEGAAQALGLSRRMIGYYLSGEKVIPRTVMLATQGWAKSVDAERAPV